VNLLLSSKNNRNNYYSSNNRSSIRREKEDTNRDNNDKPLAKLLIVDDDPDIVHILKLGLLKNGFLVTAFTNPEDALQSFKSNAEAYCLVLSDIRMPALSGIQLARKVKEINPNVKVVLMTSFEIRDSEFSKVFPSVQVDGFVQKPIGIRDLTNKILRLIGQTKRRKEGERGDDFEG
jgi:two-component system cell cycle sensor histidine kinase/response regulator CckA